MMMKSIGISQEIQLIIEKSALERKSALGEDSMRS